MIKTKPNYQEPTYRVEDITDKDLYYCYSLEEAMNYINFWNHEMILQHRTLSSWEDLEYYERSNK